MIKICVHCEEIISDTEDWAEMDNAWGAPSGEFLCEKCHWSRIDHYLETCQE
jgi:hypothetical protein